MASGSCEEIMKEEHRVEEQYRQPPFGTGRRIAVSMMWTRNKLWPTDVFTHLVLNLSV